MLPDRITAWASVLRERIDALRRRPVVGYSLAGAGGVWWLIGQLGDTDFFLTRIIPAVQPMVESLMAALAVIGQSPLTPLSIMVIGFALLLMQKPTPTPTDGNDVALDVEHDSVLWAVDRGWVRGPLCPVHTVQLLFTGQRSDSPSDTRRLRDGDSTVDIDARYAGLYCPSCRKAYQLRADGGHKLVSSSKLEATTLLKVKHAEERQRSMTAKKG